MEVSRGFSMEKLPSELKLKIMESLSGNELAQLEFLSSEWKGLIRSSGKLWEKMCYKIVEKLPDCLKLKELPPEGLNWKELFALWTVLLRNQLLFRSFFLKRYVYGLDILFYQALPRRRPVRYYPEFSSSFSWEFLPSDWEDEDEGPHSENSVNKANVDVDSSDSGSSAYHAREVIIID